MHGRFVFGFLSSSIPQVLFLTLAGGAWAAPPSPSAPNVDTRVCVARADGFLHARLGSWQQRLNLADWRISLEMSHAGDLKPKTLGNIHWDAAKKTATIRVLDASDYRLPCPAALSDMELTLVHELVHLELSSLPRSPASRHEEELAVNRIADALVRLDRQEEGSAAPAPTSDTPRSRADVPAPTW
jgi:hypothetical protein